MGNPGATSRTTIPYNKGARMTCHDGGCIIIDEVSTLPPSTFLLFPPLPFFLLLSPPLPYPPPLYSFCLPFLFLFALILSLPTLCLYHLLYFT